MASQAPNIDRLSNAFLVVSKESAKFGNIPALNQGAQILEALERVQQRVEQMQQRVEQMQQTQTQMQQTQTQMQQTQEQMQQTQEQMQIAIQRMFDRFETRAIASNLNATARTQNSVVSFADRRLTPLVNSVTGEEIEGFPDTPVSLGRIPTTAINRILSALEYGTVGSLEEKRDRLRTAIGLKVGGV